MSNIKLSVIIPAYNESERIVSTLESLKQFFAAHSDMSHEVIIVDDGSTDDTVAVVKRCTQTMPSVKILENGKNRGKGFSVNAGMQHATGAYHVFMDADNSVDISHIDRFLEVMDKGYDVVIGSIQMHDALVHEQSGWHRRILGNCAKILIGFFSVPGIKDTQRGFKVFSKDASKIIFPRQTICRFGFDIEILMIAWINGLKIKELPVAWNNPAGSKVTLWSYVQTLRELSYIVWNRMLGKYSPNVHTKYLSEHN